MIKCYENGVFAQNAWIYSNPATNEAIVVDPGDELEGLFDLIGNDKVTHIFITHGHEIGRASCRERVLRLV